MENPGQTPEIRRNVERWIIDIALKLLALGLFVYWSFQLIAPFILVIVWSAILATAIYPLYAWMKPKLGGRSAPTAIILTLLGLALILGPAAALVASLAGTVQEFSADLAQGTFSLPPPDPAVQEWPVVGAKIYEAWTTIYADLPGVLGRHSQFLVSTGSTLLGLAARLGGDVVIFAASIIIAGFLYSRGTRLAEGGRRFGRRLDDERGSSFVDLAGATVRNVSRGVIGISVLQALLAGIGLLVAGVPGAGIITFGVLLLAIIQVGPGILLFPVIIWMWVWSDMGTLTAALFTAWMIPVLTFDNILKPIVMSRGLKTPMLVIFVGVIGGTLAHGLIGLFLGPIVLAVFYELAVAWLYGDPPADDAPAPEPRP